MTTTYSASGQHSHCRRRPGTARTMVGRVRRAARAAAIRGGLDDALRCVGADGAVAVLTSAFPPLPAIGPDDDQARAFVAHACASRVIALVLVRLGGYAAGVFDGDQRAGDQGRKPPSARPVIGRRVVAAAIRAATRRAGQGGLGERHQHRGCRCTAVADRASMRSSPAATGKRCERCSLTVVLMRCDP